MKRYFILLLLPLFFLSNVIAQKKGDWGELYLTVDQSMLFTSSDLHLSNRVIHSTLIGIGVELNLRGIKDELTCYYEMALGPMSTRQMEQTINQFGELDNNTNFSILEENHFEAKGSVFKQTIGLSYRFYKNNWRLSPRLGVGMLIMDGPSKWFIQKENNSNNMYIVDYEMIRPNVDSFGFLQVGLKAQKKIFKRFSLNFVIAYMPYISGIEYYAARKNRYTQKVLEEVAIRKCPHELTFSVGIGFR